MKEDKRRNQPKDFGDYINEFLQGSQQPCRALRRFIHYNLHFVKSYTCDGMFNLFLDKHLGGGGVDQPQSYENYRTPFQTRLAMELFKRPIAETGLGVVAENSSNTLVFDRRHLFKPCLRPVCIGPDLPSINEQSLGRELSLHFSVPREETQESVRFKDPYKVYRSQIRRMMKEKGKWVENPEPFEFGRYKLVYETRDNTISIPISPHIPMDDYIC